MVDKDFEDAHYWHVLYDVADLINHYGYEYVQDHIDYLLEASHNEASK